MLVGVVEPGKDGRIDAAGSRRGIQVACLSARKALLVHVARHPLGASRGVSELAVCGIDERGRLGELRVLVIKGDVGIETRDEANEVERGERLLEGCLAHGTHGIGARRVGDRRKAQALVQVDVVLAVVVLDLPLAMVGDVKLAICLGNESGVLRSRLLLRRCCKSSNGHETRGKGKRAEAGYDLSQERSLWLCEHLRFLSSRHGEPVAILWSIVRTAAVLSKLTRRNDK